MGFFSGLSKVFKSVSSVAKPFGTMLGSVAGGLQGAGQISSFFGGPSSLGGITGGAERGGEARDYYDQAFPGTNPWERLGAGNPMGQLGAAEIGAKAQKHNVSVQARTQENVAKIQAAGAANVANIHNVPALRQAGAAESQAATAGYQAAIAKTRAHSDRMNAITNQKLLAIKRETLEAHIGHSLRDPGTAKLASVAYNAWRIGMSQQTFVRWMNDNPKKMTALGVSVSVGRGAAQMLSGIFGRGSLKVKKFPSRTSVRTKVFPPNYSGPN